ncbi:putative iron-sulfur cluster insertion protein ErpA [Rhodospirillaceae bacterium LM-1]|nr:putative iron-sulfur cluster insertion protein ErpA [Rhodospirillaceae bacterium LM-1]
MVDSGLADIALTESAAERIRILIEGEGNPALKLRLSVQGGGCSGFSYGITLDAETQQGDSVFENHGIQIVIDDASLDLLRGTEVDFVEDLSGSSFVLRNPNASSTCGCGNSFSV